MGSRTMPTDCERCGRCADPGDFGPFPREVMCTCEPTLLVWLREQHAEVRRVAEDAVMAGHLRLAAHFTGKRDAYRHVARYHGWDLRKAE